MYEVLGLLAKIIKLKQNGWSVLVALVYVKLKTRQVSFFSLSFFYVIYISQQQIMLGIHTIILSSDKV